MKEGRSSGKAETGVQRRTGIQRNSPASPYHCEQRGAWRSHMHRTTAIFARTMLGGGCEVLHVHKRST